MPQDFSLAYLTVMPIAPPDMVSIAARAGYQFVSLRLIPVTPQEPAYDLATDRGLMRQTKHALADTGVGVLDIELVKLYPDTATSRFEPALEAGAELGARHVIVGGYDPDRARLTDNFASICDLAQRFGLSANLEFVTWTDVSDLKEAAAVVSGAARPGGGILVDLLHFSRSHCRLEEIDALPPEWFRFVQICDAPAAEPSSVDDLIETARRGRRYLGQGGLDVAGILAHLPQGIPYSLEIPTDDGSSGTTAEERAQRAIDTAKAFLAKAQAEVS